MKKLLCTLFLGLSSLTYSGDCPKPNKDWEGVPDWYIQNIRETARKNREAQTRDWDSFMAQNADKINAFAAKLLEQQRKERGQFQPVEPIHPVDLATHIFKEGMPSDQEGFCHLVQDAWNIPRSEHQECFTPETKVWAPDGLIEIGLLECGDTVLSLDQNSKTLQLAVVKDVYRSQVDQYLELNIGDKVIKSTTDHPFFRENGELVAANALQVGDRLQGYANDTYAVKSIQRIHEPQQVINLQTDAEHNYFISFQEGYTVTPQTPFICVHNCDPQKEGAMGLAKIGFLGLGAIWGGLVETVGSFWPSSWRSASKSNIHREQPYDPRQTRADLEAKHGKANVKSSTTPSASNARKTVTVKEGVQIIYGENGSRAVVVKYDHPVTGKASTANVPYNNRGLPVFDDYAKYTTKIDHSQSYTGQMRQATRDLRDAINRGRISENQFTSRQLSQIKSGEATIKGYTWHHNGDSGNMQLVPRDVHNAVKHIGQNALKEGK